MKLKIFLSINVLINDFKEVSLVLNDAQGRPPNLHFWDFDVRDELSFLKLFNIYLSWEGAPHIEVMILIYGCR